MGRRRSWSVALVVLTTAGEALGATASRIDEMPQESKRYALLIGVQDYDKGSGLVSLDGPNNDVAALKGALRLSGFEDEHIVVLASDQPDERKPTRTNILSALFGLKDWVRPDGLLVIAFSGHGYELNSSEDYLLPSDVKFKADPDLLKNIAIPLTMIRDAVKDRVKQVIVLLDACRDQFESGKKNIPEPNVLGANVEQVLKWDRQNDRVEAYAVLYATEGGHSAYVYQEKHQGYFSWTLVEGLMGKAKDRRDRITLEGLERYLEDHVPMLVRRDYGSTAIQKPHLSLDGFHANDLLLRRISKEDAAFGYMLSGSIQPLAGVLQQFDRTFDLHDELNSCAETGDRVASYCLDEAQSPVTVANVDQKACAAATKIASAVTDRSNARCVRVTYHLEGCAAQPPPTQASGWRIFSLFQSAPPPPAPVGCAAAPSLDAKITLRSTRVERKPLGTKSIPLTAESGTTLDAAFDYDLPVPPSVGNLSWKYDVTVIRQQGQGVFQSHVTSETPSQRGVASEISPSGRLTIDVSEAMKIWRGLERDTASTH